MQQRVVGASYHFISEGYMKRPCPQRSPSFLQFFKFAGPSIVNTSGDPKNTTAQRLLKRTLRPGWAPSAKVVADHLQTTILEALDAPNLEVCKHDISADDVEADIFDLVSWSFAFAVPQACQLPE